MMDRYWKWIRSGIFLWTLLMGAMVAWTMRYEIDPDALAYIDFAKAYLHTPWYEIPNGYWNPLFSFLIAGAFYLLRPEVVWEVPVAELVFWLTFVFAGLSYLYLERWLVKWQETRDGSPCLPEKRRLLFLFGITAFATSSAMMLKVYMQADVLINAFFFLSCALIFKFKSGAGRWVDLLFLALTLSLGYLSKAAFFPLSFVFIAILFFVLPRGHGRWLRCGVVLALFLTVSAVQWLPLSLNRERFTFGDTGKINYVAIAGVDAAYARSIWFPYWQSNPDGSPLKHPMRMLSKSPDIYSFDCPTPGVFPLWDDPSYWVDGIKMRFYPVRLLALQFLNGQKYLNVLMEGFGYSVLTLIVLAVLTPLKHVSWRGFPWEVAAVAVIGIGTYLVIMIFPRYVTGYTLVLLLLLFWQGLRSMEGEKLRALEALTVVSCLVALLTVTSAYGLVIRKEIAVKGGVLTANNDTIRAAKDLEAAGVQPGMRVMHVGAEMDLYLGQLAQIRYVGCVYNAQDFWKADETERARLLRILREEGKADVVLAIAPPPLYSIQNWVPVGETKFLLYRFK